MEKQKRGRGRPRSEHPKKMVTLRIEEKTWDALGEAVKRGLIKSKQQTINEALRENLERLKRECPDCFAGS